MRPNHAVVHLAHRLSEGVPTRASLEQLLGTPLSHFPAPSREEYRGSTDVGEPPTHVLCSFIFFPAQRVARVDLKFAPPTPSEWWLGTVESMGPLEISVAPLAFVAPGVKGGAASVTSRFRLAPGATLSLRRDGDSGVVTNASIEWAL